MVALDFPSTPSNGQVFGQYVYDGTKAVWRLNPETPNANLDNLNDVTITSAVDGQALVFDSASGDWINETPASTVDSLTDVTITTPLDEQALIYNTATGNWINAAVAGGVEVSATAPAAPSAGDLWWNSTIGDLFVYYNDGDSSQWVPASGPKVTVAATAPTGYEGQLWLDDTDGSMYVYYTDPGGGSSSWIGAVSRSGGILQVVSTTKSDAFSASIGSNSFSSNVTGLAATITPSSTSSKILVITQLYGASGISNYPIVTYRIDRNGTPVGVGDLVGSRPQVTAKSWVVVNESNSQISSSATFLDSPATTSSLTYGVQLHNHDTTTQTYYLNRSSGDTNDRLGGRPISTITLMEVAG
jgi:hypothetical protein